MVKFMHATSAMIILFVHFIILTIIIPMIIMIIKNTTPKHDMTMNSVDSFYQNNFSSGVSFGL